MRESSTTDYEEREVPEYRVPRGGVSSIDELPLDPLDGRALDRELRSHPETGVKRELRVVAGRIQSAKAAVEKNTRQTLQETNGGNVLSVNISPERELMGNPGGFPAAQRARSQQINLRTDVNRFAELCETHFNRINEQS